MYLYQLHDLSHVALTPFRLMAGMAQISFDNPFAPASVNQMGRAVVSTAELFERASRVYKKPTFDLATTKIRGQTMCVKEEVFVTKPFCELRHFVRTPAPKNDPKVLIIAPLSGHHATLLRGTVAAMLPEHDVYITDWIDAKLVPLSKGKFDVDDFTSYVVDFIQRLGPDLHVISVSQPAPEVLAALAILAERNDPTQPYSATFIGGPIDVKASKTIVTELTEKNKLTWFEDKLVQAVPLYHPGACRLVYPGFIQLHNLVSVNLKRHLSAQIKFFKHLVRGDEEEIDKQVDFYNEYLSVMDVPAEFLLQTTERIYQKNELASGQFHWNGKLVKPELIKRTAIMTIEGELDDISAPGQTRRALTLCSGLAENMKLSHLQIGVGHYGIFNGKKWREVIQPMVRNFIRDHSNGAIGKDSIEIPGIKQNSANIIRENSAGIRVYSWNR